MNGDGSVDLYSEPNALTGLEGSWIPTMGKGTVPLAPALRTRRGILDQWS